MIVKCSRITAFATIATMALFLTLSFPSFAANSGDMFGNTGAGPANSTDLFGNTNAGSANRPSVPSDAVVGPDMFRPEPVFIEPNADALSRMKPANDFGQQDMFVVHPEPAPPYPLFDDRER